MSKHKQSFLHRINDVSKIHHRAAFSSVEKHVSMLKHETHFNTLASTRFSCRSFSPRQVEPAKIRKILDTARYAPSAKNQQPVHVWALRSEESLERLREVHPAYGAPVIYIVGYKPEEAWKRSFDGKSSGETDAAILCTHILLEATDLGLCSVWIGAFDPARMKEKFPETEGYEVTAILALGYPSDDAEESPMHLDRKPIEEVVTKL